MPITLVDNLRQAFSFFLFLFFLNKLHFYSSYFLIFVFIIFFIELHTVSSHSVMSISGEAFSKIPAAKVTQLLTHYNTFNI